jgi:hypothetical protein
MGAAQPYLASGFAVGLAIFFMERTNSVHPPGGATALVAVIGSETVHKCVRGLAGVGLRGDKKGGGDGVSGEGEFGGPWPILCGVEWGERRELTLMNLYHFPFPPANKNHTGPGTSSSSFPA